MRKIQFISLFTLLVLAFSYSTANADPPIAVFQLDGDAAYTTACTSTFPSLTPVGCKDDWNLLNGTQIANDHGAPGASLARSFISGAASIAVFTTGGSKDPSDISSWKWKNGGTPDKDAITNGYAAAYKSPEGHFILLFGADRFAVNGDANIGFWFFQQDVHPVGATGGGFSNGHVKNDLFIVSAFTQGGGVSTITVYAWDQACTNAAIAKNPTPGQCADNNLRLIFASTPSTTCANGNAGCSIVNPTGISVAWPYLTKFGSNNTTIPEGGFYEGGLDITDMFELLGQGNTPLPCFSSFLIETRSSQTPSAVLKDFVSGSFSICGMNTTKSCAGDGTLINNGTAIHYIFNGTATNTGIGALYHTTIVDTLPAGASNVVFKAGTPLATVSSAACPSGYPAGTTCADIGSLDAAAVVNWSVEFDSDSTSVQNTATARASSSANAIPGACAAASTVCSSKDSDPSTCSKTPVNNITISKNCGVPVDFFSAGHPASRVPGTQLVTSGSVVAAQVNFSGVIENKGDSALENVSVSDSPDADITVDWPGATGTLLPGEHANYSGSYKPSGVTLNDLGCSAPRYSFSDEIKVTGATAVVGAAPGHELTCTSVFAGDAQACASATCNMCPGSNTCSTP